MTVERSIPKVKVFTVRSQLAQWALSPVNKITTVVHLTTTGVWQGRLGKELSVVGVRFFPVATARVQKCVMVNTVASQEALLRAGRLAA